MKLRNTVVLAMIIELKYTVDSILAYNKKNLFVKRQNEMFENVESSERKILFK